MEKHDVLHLSDLHGNLKPLWKIIESGLSFDTIVLSGDICPNHMAYYKDEATGRVPKAYEQFQGRRICNRPRESAHQSQWAKNALKPLLDRIPHKHLVIVNGNHDFCDFAEAFPEAHTLFQGAKVIEIDGHKWGLAVGISPLAFEWHEELPEFEFNELLLTLDPTIEVLVTHAPPNQILDANYGGQRIGYTCLYKHLFGLTLANIPPTFTNLHTHFFGHAHEANGIKEIQIDEKRTIVFSNAACGANVVNFDDRTEGEVKPSSEPAKVQAPTINDAINNIGGGDV